MTRRRIQRSLVLVVVAVAAAACGSGRSTAGTPTVATRAVSAGPLVAPKTTPAQDGQYLADVAKADPDLASYVQQQGNVALQALLTDGAAFCAFLHRGGGIDSAMTAVVIGAKGVEQQTRLPSTVTTFNTIDAVALLTLCPAEQSLIPSADRSRIANLGREVDG